MFARDDGVCFFLFARGCAYGKKKHPRPLQDMLSAIRSAGLTDQMAKFLSYKAVELAMVGA